MLLTLRLITSSATMNAVRSPIFVFAIATLTSPEVEVVSVDPAFCCRHVARYAAACAGVSNCVIRSISVRSSAQAVPAQCCWLSVVLAFEIWPCDRSSDVTVTPSAAGWVPWYQPTPKSRGVSIFAVSTGAAGGPNTGIGGGEIRYAACHARAAAASAVWLPAQVLAAFPPADKQPPTARPGTTANKMASRRRPTGVWSPLPIGEQEADDDAQR